MSIAHLEVNGIHYVSATSLAERVSYSRDHITRLAREKKVKALQVDRDWFVSEEALRQYQAMQVVEKQVRQNVLRQKRRQDQTLFAARHVQERTRRAPKDLSVLIAIGGGVLCVQLFLLVVLPAFETTSTTSESVVAADQTAIIPQAFNPPVLTPVFSDLSSEEEVITLVSPAYE